MRQEADYDFDVDYDEITARTYLEKAKQFVNAIEIVSKRKRLNTNKIFD